MSITIRNLIETDILALFEHQLDPERPRWQPSLHGIKKPSTPIG